MTHQGGDLASVGDLSGRVDQLQSAVPFPPDGHRVSVQHGVESGRRSQQRHVAEHGGERVQTRVTLHEVLLVTPRRSVDTRGTWFGQEGPW